MFDHTDAMKRAAAQAEKNIEGMLAGRGLWEKAQQHVEDLKSQFADQLTLRAKQRVRDMANDKEKKELTDRGFFEEDFDMPPTRPCMAGANDGNATKEPIKTLEEEMNIRCDELLNRIIEFPAKVKRQKSPAKRKGKNLSTDRKRKKRRAN